MSETDVGLSTLPDGWVWTTLGAVIQIIEGEHRFTVQKVSLIYGQPI